MGEDTAYYARREALIQKLQRHPMTARELADALGWPMGEVSGKLRSLMTERRVERDGRMWRLTRAF